MQQKSELPEGWTISNLNEISDDVKYGYTASAEKSAVGPHLLRITDIQDGKVDWENVPFCKIKEEQISKYELKPNDIVFARTGATTGKSYLISSCPRSVFASYLIRLRPNENIDPMFLSLFFNTYDYWEQISQNISGIAQPNCNATKLKELILPLPPLPEQHRIVLAIEAIFARLDKTNEKLDRVPEILKKFRESVLAAACEGRLTEEWRKINQIKEDSWSDLEFFDFCVLQRGYDLPISKRRDGPYPIMASSGILAYHDECKASGPGVVVGRSGSTGKVHYTDEDYWPHNTTLFVKDFKENYPKFVYLFLINFNLEQYSASTAVPTLNRNNLRGIIVSIPSFYEQQEIVRRVDALFSFADSIETKVAAAREKTEKLRQSILAKAFSGELVEIEAEIARREGRDYETAEVLLERIKSEKGP